MIVNLTPHEIVVYDEKQENIIARFPPSGQVARVEMKYHKLNLDIDNNGVPLYSAICGGTTGLPPQKNGPNGYVYYIVSAQVKADLEGTNRSDLLVPAQLVRDKKGNVIGCCGFRIY